ncbi:MAG: hypothetical protein AAB706_02025 [Patescibacteria group bacterium]
MKKLFATLSFLIITSGILMIGGGAWGIKFTYTHIAQEKITTPDDASIPGVPVRGPLTLKAQADIIRTHMLRTAGGKTYAEMPRQIAKLDENGAPVLDKDGKPVMITNTARDTWITANVLITALNLAIMAYAFSGFMLLVGFVFLFIGIMLFVLRKKY